MAPLEPLEQEREDGRDKLACFKAASPHSLCEWEVIRRRRDLRIPTYPPDLETLSILEN